MGTVAVVALGLAACGAEDRRTHIDAYQGSSVDRSVAHITAMPNDFGNVADKCRDGLPFRIFVTTNTSSTPSQMVVLPDPSCAK